MIRMLTGDGEELSQGQRQLLAIARAAIADPPVLILDEATSSIDTRTEAIVQQGMDNLMKGRTVFVIAHRLSTIRNSDAIIVLEHGRIIERGTHEDLIEAEGHLLPALYRKARAFLRIFRAAKLPAIFGREFFMRQYGEKRKRWHMDEQAGKAPPHSFRRKCKSHKQLNKKGFLCYHILYAYMCSFLMERSGYASLYHDFSICRCGRRDSAFCALSGAFGKKRNKIFQRAGGSPGSAGKATCAFLRVRFSMSCC